MQALSPAREEQRAEQQQAAMELKLALIQAEEGCAPGLATLEEQLQQAEDRVRDAQVV